MSTLREIQEALQHYIQNKPSTIESMVTGKNIKEVKRRLDIYREGYALRLMENLKKQYPALVKAMGLEKFQQLSQDYQTAYPPTDRIIRRYGASLVTYLRSISAEKHLVELAEFEWARTIALDDSAEASTLTLADLQALSPEDFTQMHFHFQASLHVFAFEHNIPHYWMALEKNASKKIIAEKTHAPYYYAVWRKDYIPYHLLITALNFQLLTAAKAGAHFADLCELAIGKLSEEEASQNVAQTVLQWVQHGWLKK